MKTNLLFLLLFFSCFLSSTTYSQDRNYQKKSITSLDAVVYYQAVSNEVDDIIKNRLNKHIEAERFYVDPISLTSVQKFKQSLRIGKMSVSEVASKLEATVIPEFTSILSADAALRAKENLTEEQRLSALVEQFNEMGVTGETILKMMNSGYIYLPVVTSYNETTSNNSLTASINGYILWYKLVYDNDGNFDKIVLVSDSTKISSGMGTATIGSSYDLKSRKVDGKLYAKISAIDTWARNLAVVMKDIPDFSLSGEVLSVSGSSIETNLGTKEDVALDDGFYLIDYTLNDEGEQVKQVKGFFRADRVGNNKLDENSTSRFVQYFGDRPQRGMLLSEHPTLGIDLTIRPLYSQINMPQTDWGYFFSKDVKNSAGINLQLQKNIAKQMKISQVFVNLDVGLGVVMTETSSYVDVSKPLLLTAHLGISKKFWFQRMNLELGIAGGYNGISFKNNKNDYDYSFHTLGARFDAGLNYMLNEDFSAGIYMAYKYTSNVSSITVKDKDGNEISSYGISSNDTNFTGISFGVGISYTLPSLGVNPFAALTDDKIDY